nr:retrovirus-related Pol polyprotein from transposon TNT 1-94 [Tanacetum cinerariifolium]
MIPKRSGSKRGRGNPRGHGRGRGHYGHNRFSNQNYCYHRGGYNGHGRGRGRGQRNYTYHAPQSRNIGNKKYLLIMDENQAFETLPMLHSGLHYIHNNVSQAPMAVKEKYCDPVERMRLDNTEEFTSHAFHDYCMSVGIVIEHSVAHVYTQNGLAESLIKCLQLIAIPMIMRTKLPRLKRGRPIGSRDKNPRKRKRTEKNADHDENVLDETQDIKTSHEEEMNDMNKEMPINYSQTNILWDRNEIGDIDEIFSYSVASDIMSGDDDPEPRKGYKSNLIYPCVFIKKTTYGFVIIAVYVDDLNIIGTNKEINKVVMNLKEELEMKDLGNTKYCLGLQIKHMPNGILVHQSNYIETVLKRFNMDKAKYLSTPMVGRSLNVDNDPFRPCEEGEDVLGLEVPYLSAIGALMYLTNCTIPDISFAVNLLARFSSSPTKRHWNEIKHIF